MYPLPMNLVRFQPRYAAATSLCFHGGTFNNRGGDNSSMSVRRYGTNRCYSALSKNTYRAKQYVDFVRKSYNFEPSLVAISVASTSTSSSASSSSTDDSKKRMPKMSMLSAAKHSIVEPHNDEYNLRNNDNQKAVDEVTKTVTVIDHFPSAIQPYLRLIRIDKPIGSWLLFWPCAWSIGLATSPGCLPDPYMMALFGAGAVLLRSAGCIINDMFDKDIDAKVERTKNRPIAAGQMTRLDAFVFLSGLLALGDLVLIQMNSYCILLGASGLGLISTYPIMKRITYWPQLYLGFAMNFGALMGWAALEGVCDFSVCLPLYVGCISWTLIYDTIYAHQDKKDDAVAGVKSTALFMGDKTKNYLTGFTATMTTGFIAAGIMSDQTLPYYIAVGLATSHIIHQIVTLNINNPAECGKKFASNNLLGFIIMAGIIASTLLKAKKETSTKKISGKIEIGQSVTL